MKRGCVIIIILLTIICPKGLYAQFYSTGEPPASVKWNVIRSPHFSIVFPSGLYEAANKAGNMLEFYYPYTMGDMGYKINRSRLPVVLHHHSVFSNGYVTLAPQRMELVTTPPQGLTGQDWLSQLVLHEFRHTVQLNLLHQGFTRFMGFLAGEAAHGIVSSQIPSWFYEGDAVYSETMLSASGRGRIPAFEMPLRALLTSSIPLYSYDKAVFGSYRNFVPDHYVYGYIMVKTGRALYGSSLWPDALDYTARHPFLIWPLAFYLKKHTGSFKSGLYIKTMDILKRQYDKQIDTSTYINYESINSGRTSTYASYAQPHEGSRHRIITFRSSLDEPSGFTIIDSSGSERTQQITGDIGRFDVYGNLLIWDETVRDPRWEQRSYSIIRCMDLTNGKIKKLTEKTRFFSPAFSPDGSRIIVSENDLVNINYITIISTENGNVVKRIAAEEKTILTPGWIDDSTIMVITVQNDIRNLEMVSLSSGKWTILPAVENMEIAEPVAWEKYIIFRAADKLTENLYATDTTGNGAVYRITRARYGAFNPSVTYDQGYLLFSGYGKDGFDVHRIPIDTSVWILTDKRDLTFRRNAVISYHDSIPKTRFTAVPYRKAGHLIHFHSWMPFYTDLEKLTENPDELQVSPGVMLFSQNLLSTFISSIGYSYDQGYHYVIPSLQWRGWYPVIEIKAKTGGPQRRFSVPEGVDVSGSRTPNFELNVRSYVPLYFERVGHITTLTPEIEYEHSSVLYLVSGDLKKGMDMIHLKMNAGNFRRSAFRDLYPVWAQTLNATYSKSIKADGQFGSLYSIRTGLYFPGIFRHHHFIAVAGLQIQDPGRYYLPVSRIDFPRGAGTFASKQLYSLKLNYAFPAGYPDISLGPLMYVKRFRAGLFYDTAYGKDVREPAGVRYTGYYQSFGMELFSDMHLFRIIFPVSAGIRFGYLAGKEKVFAEFMMNVSTDGF